MKRHLLHYKDKVKEVFVTPGKCQVTTKRYRQASKGPATLSGVPNGPFRNMKADVASLTSWLTSLPINEKGAELISINVLVSSVQSGCHLYSLPSLVH